MFTPGSCYFSTSEAKTLLRASLCNPCSRQGVEGRQGEAFLSWTVGEAEEKCPGRPSGPRSSGQLFHFVVIFEDSAHRCFRAVLWRERLRFAASRGGCCPGAGLGLRAEPGRGGTPQIPAGAWRFLQRAVEETRRGTCFLIS